MLDGRNGAEVSSFTACGTDLTGGVFVAAGGVTGDGRADVVAGAGAGGGPHVEAFDGVTGRPACSFMA